MCSQDIGSAVCGSSALTAAARGRVWAFVANCLFFSSINQTDQMLVHLQSFDTVPEHFTIPESTKNGVPLFYIPPGSTTPVCSLSLFNVGQVVSPAYSCTQASSLAHLVFSLCSSVRVQVWCSEHPMSYISLSVAAAPLSPTASLLSVL